MIAAPNEPDRQAAKPLDANQGDTSDGVPERPRHSHRELWLSLGGFVLVFLLGAAVLLSSAPGGLGRFVARLGGGQPLTLTILHTNDTWGYLNACGCSVPLGGVARRATLIEGVRADVNPSLVLDAGNALINDDQPAVLTRGATSIEALNRLGYDAVALGLTDLTQLSLDELQARLPEAHFPMLSANVYLTERGELLAEPYVVLPVGDHQVGILGLTAVGEVDGLLITDPIEAAAQYLPELREKADIIVVLSTAGPEVNRAIAAESGVDVVVGGSDPDLISPLYLPSNGALVLPGDSPRPGAAGRRVGWAYLTFDGSGYLTAHQWQALGVSADTYAEDAAMAAWVAEVSATPEVGDQ